MKFTRLRISGFKSFVEPTELYIEPGLTAIVGPNGCGKSNLFDALRWVMGESRPTSVRGSEMDDVIFAGSAGRPPRNVAEVTLAVDNADRTANPPYQDYESIEVSRRIEREAGSVYRINGRDVRQRDVQIFFADANSGAASTAFVRQGMIGQLVSQKPLARRAILEEAAGIAGLHQRRHEAELRLKAAETNLSRLDDVIKEVEGQLASLKRQARQASRYRNLSGHIRRAESLAFYLRWTAAELRATTAREALQAAVAVVEQATETAAVATTIQADTSEALPPLRQVEAERAAALTRLIRQREELEAEEARARELAQSLRQRIAQTAQDLEREHALNSDAQTAIESLTVEANDLEAAQERAVQDLADAELKNGEMNAALYAAEKLLERLTAELAERNAKQASLERQRRVANELAETAAVQLLAAENRFAEAQASAAADPDVAAAERAVVEARRIAEIATELAEAARAEFALLDEAEHAARSRLENTEREAREAFDASEREARTTAELAEREARAALEAVERDGRAAIENAEREGRAALDAAEREGRARIEAAERDGRAAIDAAEREGRARIEDAERDGRTALDAVERERRTELDNAERDLQQLSAEAGALRRVLNSAGESKWPPLIDAVNVQPGYEGALAAALGDELQDPLDEAAPRHWRDLADFENVVPLPDGVRPLAYFVSGPHAMSRRLTMTGVAFPDQGAALQRLLKPGQRLVSPRGDLWRWDGYHASADAPSPAAVRLEQRNRLTELGGLIASAQQIRDAAAEAYQVAKAEAEEAHRAAKSAAEEAYQSAKLAAEEAYRASKLAADESYQRSKSEAEDFYLTTTTAAEEAFRAAKLAADQSYAAAKTAADETYQAAKVAAAEAFEAARTEAQQAYATAKAEAERARQALRAAEQEERNCAAAIMAAQDEANKAARQAAERAQQLATLQAEIVRITQARETALDTERQTAAALEELGNGEALTQAVDNARQSAAESRTNAANARAALDGLKRDGEARERRLAAITEERSRWESRAEAAAAQIAELERRHAELSAELVTAEEAPVQIAEKRNALLDAIGVAETVRKEAGDARAEAETRLAEADKAAKLAEHALSAAREERARAEAMLEGDQARLTELLQRVRDELDCAPEELAERAEIKDDEELPSLEIAEKKVEKLKQEREALGGVNLRAEEEAQELETRVTGLTADRDDLVGAIERLRRGIQNLNREGRERLVESFEKVNQNFQMLFSKLFEGGEAKLTFTESEDPLEAGLEIYARPPGKRLQSLALLSGGEQALTAMSLIFAVFLVNPAPVCVLDEVDAPLDDANVERFCNMLDEMTRMTDTRFLVITHHALTMSRMHRLFGVTMAERGVSQLVSVSLAEAERVAAE